MERNKINVEVYRDDVSSFIIQFDTLDDAFAYIKEQTEKYHIGLGQEIGFDFCTESSIFD